MKKRATAILLCLALALSMSGVLAGCGAEQGADLMDGVKAAAPSGALTSDGSAAATEFGVRLFQQGVLEDKNVLISPLSVLCALAMASNGAKGETRAQMETVFGMNIEDLNGYLCAYLKQLPQGETYKLSLANAIWFKDTPSFAVEPDFLQINANYYGAGLYKAAFDEATRDEINDWVEKNTDGMIKNILDKIPKEAVMYLVNALAFDAEWQIIYKEDQIRNGTFTKEDGTTQNVELMYSDENRYLEDDRATGFIKNYADGKYAFVALLPKEGVSVAEYAASLTGEHLQTLLANPQQTTVQTAIPKFESDYSVDLSSVLQRMGMKLAFGGGDLSGIGTSAEGPLAISRVLHKTYIAVDEKGTKAGAATAVEVNTECAIVSPERKVILDRPFVYLIIDPNTNVPVFIGTVMDVG